MRAFESRSIHHCERICHPLIGSRNPRRAVGHAGASLVEADDARKSGHPLEPPDPPRLLPVEGEMGYPARNHQQVGYALAGDLVGDVQTAAARVSDLGWHAADSVRRGESVRDEMALRLRSGDIPEL